MSFDFCQFYSSQIMMEGLIKMRDQQNKKSTTSKYLIIQHFSMLNNNKMNNLCFKETESLPRTLIIVQQALFYLPRYLKDRDTCRLMKMLTLISSQTMHLLTE